jgi:signal transduction histidine kinase
MQVGGQGDAPLREPRREHATELALSRLDELRRLDRELSVGRIVAVLAHAVGTPLNVIVGRAGLIRSIPNVSESVIREVEGIEKKVEQLSQRLRAAVDFYARSKSSTPSQQVTNVVADAMSVYALVARSKSITLRLAEDASTGPPGLVDPALVGVVLANLLSLAISIADGDSTIEIRVSRDAAGNLHPPGMQRVSLLVPGGALASPIPLERLEFGPTPSAAVAAQQQALMLCSSIIRSNGGRLEVEPIQPASTLFNAFFPVQF